jgi:hypothetical protein
MKFVATKTADQLDLRALHRVRERLVSQRTGIINQIRAFLLERGIAVRQGLRFLRAELPGILATRTDVLSPRMLRILEDLSADWRRLDARIEGLTGEIETLARQDQHCERLMSVPGIGPIISSAMVAAIGTGDVFSKAATSAPGSGWYRNKSRRETGQSLAAYRGAAIAICALCSFRPPGSCLSRSDPSSGNYGLKYGSRRRKNDYTTTCSLLRWPISLLASRGRFSTRGAPLRATRQMRWHPVQPNPRAVLGAVKAWPGGMEARGKACATASLDRPCARREAKWRPSARTAAQAKSSQRLFSLLSPIDRFSTGSIFTSRAAKDSPSSAKWQRQIDVPALSLRVASSHRRCGAAGWHDARAGVVDRTGAPHGGFSPAFRAGSRLDGCRSRGARSVAASKHLGWRAFAGCGFSRPRHRSDGIARTRSSTARHVVGRRDSTCPVCAYPRSA